MAHTPAPCRRCGGPKGRHSYGRMRAWYCEACDRQRWVDRDMEERLCDSKDSSHSYKSCIDCQRIKRERQLESAKRGAVTRAHKYPKMFRPENAEKFWQSRAHTMVAAAIRCGFLPELDGSIACVDCGQSAHEYDHRDYGRPLDVDPVCIRCNRRRGTAIWPERRDFARIFGAPSKEAA